MLGSGPNRLLKVLHIDPERNWGGGEAQVVGLLSYLAEKGHRNDLLAHPRGPLFEKAKKLEIRAFPLVVRNDLDLRSVLWLRRLIQRERYDIVHLHTKRAHALSVWLPREAGRPKYIVTRRMDYPERKNWYTRYLYNRRVDGVVAVSQTIAALLVEAGVEPARIRLIHSGVDPKRFEHAPVDPGMSNDIPVVGTVAVLEERKGHRYLLEAAALLKAKGYRMSYLFAGEGSLKNQLEEMVNKLGLQDEVHFLGFVNDMASFFFKTDICVLPSIYEGFSGAAREAMAAGRPVVATRVGGFPELIIDSVTGLLVSPRDADGLAKAVEKLIRDKSLARKMGQRGAERVCQYFTLEQMAKKNEAHYYELLGAN